VHLVSFTTEKNLYALYFGLAVRTVYRWTAPYVCRQTSSYGL